jgi:hypothetical protein
MQDEVTRVVVLVRDKDVGKLQRLCVGLALQAPTSEPVVNAVIGKNGVSAKTTGNLCEMFHDYLRDQKMTEITPAQGRAFLAAIGRPASSSQYLWKCGQEGGYLKRSGKGHATKYLVQIAHAPKKRRKK